jgi:hypothetical protein
VKEFMIAYDLQCSNGHRFEGWFEDSQAYDRQCRQGQVACPICDDTGISRLPSTFAIKGATMASAPSSRKRPDMEQLGKQIVDFVEKNFDNVGADFATEALKMHYGVVEPRSIRGVSTPQEEETLKQEGVQFFKMPIPQKPDPEVS